METLLLFNAVLTINGTIICRVMLGMSGRTTVERYDE
jgi:hypothetical protein